MGELGPAAGTGRNIAAFEIDMQPAAPSPSVSQVGRNPTSATSPAAAAATRDIPISIRRRGPEVPEREQPFCSNIIITSKYTVLNFLPKNLLEQFQKAANTYFLIVTFIMFLGNQTRLFKGTINFASNASTLLFFMLFSAVVAALDDLRRHKADAETNAQLTRRVLVEEDGTSAIVQTDWASVKIGDLLVIMTEEQLPADMICLASSGHEGGCYVSTAQLDGETNLKVKSTAPVTQEKLCGHPEGESPSGHANDEPLLNRAVRELSSFSGTVVAEAPQRSIHNFKGCLRISGEEVALGPKELLLRGTMLRNTAWCLGIVVYTGKETRMAMNSRPAPTKVANVERIINQTLFIVVFAQSFLALTSAVAFTATRGQFVNLTYLATQEDIFLPMPVAMWLTMFVLYSPLMPISLYATMEVCNYAHGYFISNDKEMYFEEDDCPAKVRTTNLGHELGQISYIFSDKTGTLTQNVMELKQVSVNGMVFGVLDQRVGFNGVDDIREIARRNAVQAAHNDAFFEVLAVSHTVVATDAAGGGIRYEAESPDEGALVEAAASSGWRFTNRLGHSMFVEIGFGNSKRKDRYEILALNAFTSTRKRQSVVAQRPNGEKVVLVKGADTVMLDRAASCHNSVDPHLEAFSKTGLRTLVLGRRVLTEAEYQAWSIEYERAQRAMDDREERLAKVAESVESKLEILGVTAIEDKLQVGVQETIELVRKAGIKLWVLTGDKLETARNIGFSTRVLSSEMEIFIIDAGDHDVAQKTRDTLEMAKRAESVHKTVAMMITGQALEELTSSGSEGENDLLELGKVCSVVIACRVSPLQKAQMVRLVRGGVVPTPVTLAIGDGANDVPMIQEAQVGVGIAGREGKQAVNSADFGIGQFRYLQRLLLVHGRWNYRRACKYTLYSFWRAAVMVLLMAWFVLYSGYAGTSLFENWVRASYNIVLGFPIICTGVFDRDVDSAKELLRNPDLYGTGRKGLDLNAWKLSETLASAAIHASALIAMSYFSYPHFVAYGNGDYYTFGTSIFTWLIITMNYRVAFLTTTWNWCVVGGLLISWTMYFAFILGYCSFQWQISVLSPWMYQVHVHMWSTPVFWIGCIVAPLLATSIDVWKFYLVLEFKPDERDVILEAAKQRQRDLAASARSASASGLQSRTSTFGSEMANGSRTPKAASHLDASAPLVEDAGFVGQAYHSPRMSIRPSGLQANQSQSWSPESVAPLGQSPPITVNDLASFPTRRPMSSFVYDKADGSPPSKNVFVTSRPGRIDTSMAGPSLAARQPSASFGSERPGPASAEAPSQPLAPRNLPNKPSMTAFAQQELRSYQWVLTPRFTAIFLVSWGLILVVSGLIIQAAKGGNRVELQYHGPGSYFDNADWLSGDVSDCVVNATRKSTTCELKVRLKVTLEAPIYVEYVLDPFYQNHAWYLESMVWAELQGKLGGPASARDKHCKGIANKAADGKWLYPCGLVAGSMFNDTFEFEFSDLPPKALTKVGIAWPSDIKRFNNPKGYPDTPADYSWLYQRYPVEIPRNLGVETEAFAVWMRVSFSSWLTKRYAIIDQDLQEGTNLTIRVAANYRVEGKTTKSVVLTDIGYLGGPEHGFPMFLFVCGSLCLLAGVSVAATHKFCGRQPGQLRNAHVPFLDAHPLDS